MSAPHQCSLHVAYDNVLNVSDIGQQRTRVSSRERSHITRKMRLVGVTGCCSGPNEAGTGGGMTQGAAKTDDAREDFWRKPQIMNKEALELALRKGDHLGDTRDGEAALDRTHRCHQTRIYPRFHDIACWPNESGKLTCLVQWFEFARLAWRDLSERNAHLSEEDERRA